MSESVRRSARLASSKPPRPQKTVTEEIKYYKGQGLVLKSGQSYRLAVLSEDTKSSSHSIPVFTLQESGNELKFQKDKEIQIQDKEILDEIDLKPEGKFFKISKKQLADIHALFESSSEEQEEEIIAVEVTKRKASVKPVVGKKEKAKKPSKVTKYKKGVGNPSVTVINYTEDLFDPSNEPRFSGSIRSNNLNFHRAVATNNKKLFKALLASTYKIGSIMQSWGPEDFQCCLERAIAMNNQYFVKALIEEIKVPTMKKGYENTSAIHFVSTGSVSIQAYGVKTRTVQMSRGGREGNNCFTINSFYHDTLHMFHSDFFIKRIIRQGVEPEMLLLLISLLPIFENNLGMCIGECVRTGNLPLSLFMINYFLKKNGFGLNSLFEEVLKPGQLTIPKKTSITKKPIENYLVSPLHTACINPDPTHLKVLLQQCNEISYPDLEGRKVVHYAAACVSAEPLNLLMDYGININELDKFKVTPLMIAAMNNRPETARFLIEKGASIHLKSKNGRAAIHYACESGSLEALKVLLDNGADIAQPGTDRKTPLMFASKYSRFEVIKLLLERGAKDTKKDKCKRSALIWAVKNGHAKEVSLLLAHGSPFDEPDSSKNYPLHYAAAYGWTQIITLLLKAGANINVSSDWKIQPLLLAMLKGQTACVKLLLEQPGVDVNGKDESGRTLVSSAVEMLSEEGLQQLQYLLFEKKADPNITDLSQKSPLHHLCSKAKPCCDNIYLSKEERIRWEDTAWEWQVRAAVLLIDAGCDIDGVCGEGLTPVIYALKNKNKRLLEVLIDKGANMKIVSPNGGSVFHYLVSFDEEVLNICRSLLKNKEIAEASINCIDQDGFSPFLRFVEFFAVNFASYRNTVHSQQKEVMEAEMRANMAQEVNMLGESQQNLNAPATEVFNRSLKRKNPYSLKGGARVKQTARVNTQNPQLFSGNTPSQSLFNNPIIAAPIANQSATQGINSYLMANMALQIDYVELEKRVNQIMNHISEFFIETLEILVKNGADPNDTVQKLLKYRNDPQLIFQEESANMPGQNYFGNVQPSKLFITDVDGSKLYKEYGDKGLQNALHLVTCLGYPELIHYLLSLRIPLNQRDFNGNTPLALSIKLGNISKNIFLDNGADPNISDVSGNLALNHAVSNQDLVSVKLLVEKGSLINYLNKEGTTPLITAIEKKNIDIARVLLEHGADPNFRNNKKRTALHIAFNTSESTADASFDMESLLLLHNADINAVDCRNRVPLHYCFVKIGKSNEKAQIDPIESVSSACSLKNIQVNVQDFWKKTPLHYAAMRGALTSTMFLLSKNAELDLEDEDHNTALALSIKEGHANYAVMLVQKGANVMNTVKVKPNKVKPNKNKPNNNFGLFGYSSFNYNNNTYYNNNQNNLLTEGTYSMFKAAIIQGWQGLAYLLIFNGYPYMLAMQDAMTQNKFQLVKTLLAKVSDNSMLKQVNEHGQNLFHTLAIYGSNADINITKVICEQLMERGLDLHAVDGFKRNPLHYAAKSDYYVFMKILLENKVRHDVFDIENYCPLAYSIAGLRICNAKNVLELFKLYGASFNFMFSENGVMLTPLLHAIQKKAPAVIIKYLLDNGCSLKEQDSKGRTAFMYAILNNDTELVRALITEGTLSLEQTDNEKKTALHYAVQPFEYGSFENTTILELLLSSKPNPHAEDIYGNSPYKLAFFQRSQRLFEVFTRFKIKGPLPNPRKLSAYEAQYREIDFQLDAEEYIKLQKETRKTVQLERTPDSAGDFPSHYKVLDDYDIIMTKVDLSCGPYSAYVFYRMQLLVDPNRDVNILFTRWGRIGEVGAFQRTPFGDRDEAVSEFKKIFKAKSGNEWGNEFERKKGKYVLMKLDLQQVNCKDFISEFKQDVYPKSNLPHELENAVKSFSSQTLYRESLSNFKFNLNILNFSTLSKETIDKAEKILIEIAVNSKRMLEEQDTNIKIEILQDLQELTSRYYELIPIVHNENNALAPLISIEVIKKSLDTVYLLRNIELASKIILGALNNQIKINPYEYIYRCLDTNLIPLSIDSEEGKLIGKYYQNGSASPQIIAAFKVNRKGESERIKKFSNVKHRKLLWHGTDCANIVGILLQGLKIAPPEVPNVGYMFGKGIYFADYIDKSQGYCFKNYGNSIGYFILLCEVVLGEVLVKYNAEFIEKLPDEYLSTQGFGRQGPDPNESIYTPYGVEVPVGKMISQSSNSVYQSLNYNEFIVYDAAQVRIRYLLHLKDR